MAIFTVILVTGLTVGLYGIFTLREILNPFKTDEQIQLKPIYRATMKGVPGFRLTGVTIEIKSI